MHTKFLAIAAVAISTTVALAQGLPGMAKGILDQTQLARQAVADHNKDAALDHVRQASALAAEIQKQAASQPKPILVPVQIDVETTTSYVDVKHRKNGEMSPDRMKKNTHVTEVESQTTASQLDITSSADRLQTAQDALDRGDWMPADTALAAIPASIIHTKADGDMPLLRARQNLMLARSRILEDKADDAKAPIRAAAQALADFERLSPGPNAERAEFIRQQMEQVAAKAGKDKSGTLEKIDEWLEPIDRWNNAAARH